MYGGGPLIVREDDDIYSRDISSDLLISSKRARTGAAVKKGGASTSNIFANPKNNPQLLFGSQESPAVGGA
jgi:hypothetical protein